MTNSKQQTAVEWFAKQSEILHYDYWAEHISKDEKNQRLKQLKEQAKEMEKEQIEEAFANGVDDEYEWHINNVPRKNSETYYNETYGGNEQ